MPVYDRWHLVHPDPSRDTPCKCSRGKNRLYPSREHGKGDRWQVRWTDENGKGRRANRPEKGGGPEDTNPDVHAEAYDAQIHASLAAGTYIDPAAGAITFQEYAADIITTRTLDTETRDRMRQRMTRHVYPLIGNKELKALARRPSLVQGVVAQMRAKVGDGTVEVIMAHVGVVFSAAVADGLIGKNPMKSSVVTVPKAKRKKVVVWTAEMVAAVREELPAAMAAMVDAGAGLGLRQGEILGLSPDDVDWVSQVVHVRRQVKIVRGRLVFAPPKGGKERTVPLSPGVETALRAHMRMHPAQRVALPWREADAEQITVVRLFFHRDGLALHRDQHVNKVWRPAIERAGIVAPPLEGEKRRPAREHGMHALRHFFASSLLTEGEAIQAVSEWLGHHSPKITLDIYAHVMPTSGPRMRAIIDRALALPGGDADARNSPDPAAPGAAMQVDGLSAP
jgi:integrase